MRVRYVCGLMGNADVDRCNAMVARGWDVTCIQMPLRDEGYRWDDTIARTFHVLAPARRFGSLAAGCTLLRQAVGGRCDVVIVYGYQKPFFWFAALLCRLLGRSVISINDSKFDDHPRSWRSDALKLLLLLPYSGFLAATTAAAAYLHYLGQRRIITYFCAIDLDRFLTPIRSGAAASIAFVERPFVSIGRLVTKKNFEGLLDAYAHYARGTDLPRPLVLCGYGDLEAAMRARIAADPLLAPNVSLVTNAASVAVADLLNRSLCLLLVSEYEEFGIVVTEALAAGRPVIASPRCGAAELVRPLINGLIVPHDDPEVIARAMGLVANEDTWTAMSAAAPVSAELADAESFPDKVLALVRHG